MTRADKSLVREVNIHYKQAQPSRLPHRVPKSPCILSSIYLSLELHTAPGTPYSQQLAGPWYRKASMMCMLISRHEQNISTLQVVELYVPATGGTQSFISAPLVYTLMAIVALLAGYASSAGHTHIR
jgi:hypothetical protein